MYVQQFWNSYIEFCELSTYVAILIFLQPDLQKSGLFHPKYTYSYYAYF